MIKLPINDVLLEIKNSLSKSTRLILEAPAGAGKSTLVPISLLKEYWLEKKIIIMLEPRRVAARAVASQMARLLGEKVGQSVGYQVKMDSCFSKNTKILVVTEGILTKKLQYDQALEDVALVIFDEFHERSIHSDLSLALCLQSQELIRPDLKILLMSATLNSSKLLNLLPNTSLITSKGRMFEIEDIYLPLSIKHPDINSLSLLLYNTILKSLKEDKGDILVFLAGTKEIRSLEEKLNTFLEAKEVEILPLHSSLSKKQQDEALGKCSKRKIILSTNISQTSLTIEGIKVVIDSGLEKQSRFSHTNDMNHLEYCFISKESATQRSGRAGRLSSGKCYKLWHKNRILQASNKPEILRSDLSYFILNLALWGVKHLSEIQLLDIPQEQIINSTKDLLKNINMLDETYNITVYGKQALNLGVHPRFANMILKANELGLAYDACLLTSLLEEKDILKDSFSCCDIYDRFLSLKNKDFNSAFIDIFRAKQVLVQAKHLFDKLKKISVIKSKEKYLDRNLQKDILGVLLLFAYPNRLAKLREKNDNRYKLSNAKGAVLNKKDLLFNSEYLVVANIIAKDKNSIISLAAYISFENIKKYFSSYLKEENTFLYNKEKQSFEIKTRTMFLKLELASKPNTNIENKEYEKLFINLIKEEGLELLTWSKKVQGLIEKVNFYNAHDKENTLNLPDFTKEALLKDIDNLLETQLQNIKTIKALKELDMYNILQAKIPWNTLKTLEDYLPSSIKVPSGSNIKIDYSNVKHPNLKVKIQEVFGLKQTPKILNNTLSLQIYLLNPALQEIQITYDLKSFWDNSYAEVRKELRGKYKRHYWPENPYEAVATSRTKKRMFIIFLEIIKRLKKFT